MKAEMVAAVSDGKGRGKEARWGRNAPLSLDGKSEWREGEARGEGKRSRRRSAQGGEALEEGGEADGWGP